jgi:Cu-processing system permease protein
MRTSRLISHPLLAVTADVFREAGARKWTLGLGATIVLLLAALAIAAHMQVVEGVVAGITLFGTVMQRDVLPLDAVANAVFRGAAYVIFYGTTTVLIFATAGFAPELLSRGRVEYMLALPLRRRDLIGGTYLAIVGLATVSALVSAAGICLLVGGKTGIWSARPVVAAACGALGFACVYGVMIAVSVATRSGVISMAAGLATMTLGTLAGLRDVVAPLFGNGLGHETFLLGTRILPPISRLGVMSADIAAGRSVGPQAMVTLVASLGLFLLGGVGLACWLFERRDY